MKNQFEQHIKESLEGFEAEYNPADWTDMQSRLNKAKAGKSSNIGKALLIAASVVATAGAIYYFSTAGKVDNTTADNSSDKNKNVVVKNENPVQSVEVRDEQVNDAVIKNNTAGEKTPATVAAEHKTVIEEKSDASTPVNAVENKKPVQEPVQVPVEQSLNTTALSASFRTDVSKVCEGAPVQFTADNADASSYKWYFGDGESSVEQNPKHIFTEAGIYAVKLRITGKDRKQAEQKNTVTVVGAPSVQIDYSASDDNGLLVNFEADGDKVVDWKWDFGDKKTASSQNPSHIYSRKGNYKVSVTAKNSVGCSSVALKDVNLKNEIDLLAPNAFSPDGNGVNDTWMPVALLNGDYVFTLTISDKAGNVVFRTTDKNNPWEGQNTKTGDTFKWIAVVKDKNGDYSNYQGLITIAE